MKMLTTLRAATFATIAGAAISLPTLAQATDYNRGYYDPGQKCRSQEKDAQLIGGLLGAVVGGVAGSQVSGNGARTEGSAIGAVLGGLAGAAIGDESVNCDKKRRKYYNNTTYNNNHYSGQTYGHTAPIVYGGTTTNRHVYQPTRTYRNNGYRNNGYTNTGYNYGYQNHYSETRAQLDDVRFRLQGLYSEDRRLQQELRYGYNPRLQNRHEHVCNEIERLQRKKRRLKKRLRRENRNYN